MVGSIKRIIGAEYCNYLFLRIGLRFEIQRTEDVINGRLFWHIGLFLKTAFFSESSQWLQCRQPFFGGTFLHECLFYFSTDSRIYLDYRICRHDNMPKRPIRTAWRRTSGESFIVNGFACHFACQNIMFSKWQPFFQRFSRKTNGKKNMFGDFRFGIDPSYSPLSCFRSRGLHVVRFPAFIHVVQDGDSHA